MDKPVLAPIVFELRGALLAAPGLDSEVVVVVLVDQVVQAMMFPNRQF